MTTTTTSATDDLILLAWVRQSALTGRARQIRIDARLSCQEVAVVVGVDQAAISRWERGQRRPHGPAGLRYARVLGKLEALARLTDEWVRQDAAS